MWRCEWCGAEFEEPAYRGFVAVCPSCREEDITNIDDELEECECCGQKVKETDASGVCEDCGIELWRIWDEAVNEAMKLNESWDYTKAETFLKEYFKSVWRDE